MIPAPFAYDRPASLVEALAAIHADPDAKVIAGGQSLLPLLKLRLAATSRLVDIGGLDELRGIARAADGGLRIGALTTYRELLDDASTRVYRCLAEAVTDIGDVQVRNRGTIGGSVAHADPASDMPAVLLALGATFVARSAGGERRIAAEDFFRGAFETALKAGEILTAVELPAASGSIGSAYRKLAQPASGYSIVGVAAVVGRSGAAISLARIGVTGVGGVAYRASAVEAALAGSDGSPAAIAAAVTHASDGRTVAADIHADRAYRTEMARVYVRRAIEGALAALG
ncbi:MAG: xanthine dehydrogenase family protein subunit M [Chloroflexi bacterium]|nr:xanthine dehydrogenase family protein subunit M [Chloroflexota bacterium]